MKNKLRQELTFLQEQGAEYADIRIVDTTRESIETENGSVKGITNSRSKGAGVRVIYDGSLGFASAQDTDDLHRVAQQALEIAKLNWTEFSVLRRPMRVCHSSMRTCRKKGTDMVLSM